MSTTDRLPVSLLLLRVDIAAVMIPWTVGR